MKHYNENDPAEMLEYIGRTDAPPFLFTRISQKIENMTSQSLPASWAWAGGLSLLLVVALNLFVVTNVTQNTENNHQSDIAGSMNLYPNNSLYQ